MFLSSITDISVQAELSIHLPAAPSTADSKALIRVYHVSVDKKTGKTSMTQIKSHKVQLRTDAGGRVDINLTLLTRLVRAKQPNCPRGENIFIFFCLRIWQKNPEENLGIVVKAHVDGNNQMELEIGAVGTREGPYLTIDIHEAGYRHRTKRTTNRVCSPEFDPDSIRDSWLPCTERIYYRSPYAIRELASAASESRTKCSAPLCFTLLHTTRISN